MHLYASSPEPELAFDGRADVEGDTEHDGAVDPWSTGYIVFSLGPNFDEAMLD